MKIVKMEKGPPTIEEGRRRLDTLLRFYCQRCRPRVYRLTYLYLRRNRNSQLRAIGRRRREKNRRYPQRRVWFRKRNYLYPRVLNRRKRPRIVLSAFSDKSTPFWVDFGYIWRSFVRVSEVSDS